MNEILVLQILICFVVDATLKNECNTETRITITRQNRQVKVSSLNIPNLPKPFNQIHAWCLEFHSAVTGIAASAVAVDAY